MTPCAFFVRRSRNHYRLTLPSRIWRSPRLIDMRAVPGSQATSSAKLGSISGPARYDRHGHPDLRPLGSFRLSFGVCTGGLRRQGSLFAVVQEERKRGPVMMIGDGVSSERIPSSDNPDPTASATSMMRPRSRRRILALLWVQAARRHRRKLPTSSCSSTALTACSTRCGWRAVRAGLRFRAFMRVSGSRLPGWWWRR